jgi:MoxR-like ATPase
MTDETTKTNSGLSATIEALSICIQAHVPAMLWGQSGAGKTKTVAAIANALLFQMWTIILSVREPTDQGGYPLVNREERVVDLVPTRWAKELTKAGQGVVFWDELNTATTPVQASALRVVDEGYAGDSKLPETTSHVAACMPHEPGSGTNPLIGAMANRWCHFTWNPSPEERITARRAGYPAPVLPKIDHELIDEGMDDANLIVSLFHEKRPQLIHSRPGDVAARGKAWPSDRTWTMAARLISAARVAGHDHKSPVMRMLVEGAVGEGASREFFSWMINMNLRNPEEYLANPTLPLPERQDQILVTLSAIAAAAVRTGPGNGDEARTRRQYAAFKVIGRVCRELKKADLCAPAARVIFSGMTSQFASNLPSDDIGPLAQMLRGAGKTVRRSRDVS